MYTPVSIHALNMYDSNEWPLPGKPWLRSSSAALRAIAPPGNSAFTLYNVDSPPSVKQTAAHSLPGATSLGKLLDSFAPLRLYTSARHSLAALGVLDPRLLKPDIPVVFVWSETFTADDPRHFLPF
ncbi:hypothetical protein ONZ51_g6849 [Trametes cubensis]|uniref:Uncharacterized protein n=1 Tax=Trametes cubensis TaxID=1111947 RepID=A0AAD7X9P4_9APHY|nr:hypothetical protein ONZ51_g6849 [Trametes cubensis]